MDKESNWCPSMLNAFHLDNPSESHEFLCSSVLPPASTQLLEILFPTSMGRPEEICCLEVSYWSGRDGEEPYSQPSEKRLEEGCLLIRVALGPFPLGNPRPVDNSLVITAQGIPVIPLTMSTAP